MKYKIFIDHGDFYATEDLTSINEHAIIEARTHFVELKDNGVILNDSFDENTWRLTDEVHKQVTLNFNIPDSECIENAAAIGSTCPAIELALKVFIIYCMGTALASLSSMCNLITKFLLSLNVPSKPVDCSILEEFLQLLPGETIQKMELLDQLHDRSAQKLSTAPKQRQLSQYLSYIRLTEVMRVFWMDATEQLRLRFFPVWFWWQVTTILPLRPTECVLTPRYCIRYENNQPYLTVRRTIRKGHAQSMKYNIEEDYEMCEYPVTEEIAQTIEWYISSTADTYESDIDVLFDKSTQFKYGHISISSDKHYTYSNLQQCLRDFYNNVVSKQYEVVPSSSGFLRGNQIETVHLGDTRHISLISIMMSGGNPVICKELARHSSINITDHYISNIRNFINVLAMESARVKKETGSTSDFGYVCRPEDAVKIQDGYCLNALVKENNFSQCEKVVDAYGHIGKCNQCCPYHFKIVAEGTNNDAQQEDDLAITFELVRMTIKLARQGLKAECDIEAMLEQFQLVAKSYMNKSVMQRIMNDTIEVKKDDKADSG